MLRVWSLSYSGPPVLVGSGAAPDVASPPTSSATTPVECVLPDYMALKWWLDTHGRAETGW